MTVWDRLRALFVAPPPKPPPGGSILLQHAIKESRVSREALQAVIDRPEPTGPTRDTIGNAIAGREETR